MEITAEYLKEHYKRMQTDELVELRSRGTLIDIAVSALDGELQSRGITHEVQAKIEREIQSERLGNNYLATLGSRLGAQLIDDLVAIFLLVIFVSVSSIEMFYIAGIIVGIAAFLGYILLSDALPNGQSLGKMALKIAVVDSQSNKPCTVSKSLFRNIPLLILGFFDWLFIFGRNRQRLGDMIAGTVVVNAKRHAQTSQSAHTS